MPKGTPARSGSRGSRGSRSTQGRNVPNLNASRRGSNPTKRSGTSIRPTTEQKAIKAKGFIFGLVCSAVSAILAVLPIYFEMPFLSRIPFVRNITYVVQGVQLKTVLISELILVIVVQFVYLTHYFERSSGKSTFNGPTYMDTSSRWGIVLLLSLFVLVYSSILLITFARSSYYIFIVTNIVTIAVQYHKFAAYKA